MVKVDANASELAILTHSDAFAPTFLKAWFILWRLYEHTAHDGLALIISNVNVKTPPLISFLS